MKKKRKFNIDVDTAEVEQILQSLKKEIPGEDHCDDDYAVWEEKDNRGQGYCAAVLMAHIDYTDAYKRKTGYSLEPGQKHIVMDDFLDVDRRVSYEEIVESLKGWLENGVRIRYRGEEVFPGIKIQVVDAYPGSIVLVFSVVLKILEFFGGLKDTYECFELIREVIKKYLSRQLTHTYGDCFEVKTEILSASPEEQAPVQASVEDPVPTTPKRIIRYKRDMFFYYLLISNVGLIAVLAALVYKAVAQVYWIG